MNTCYRLSDHDLMLGRDVRKRSTDFASKMDT